MTVAAALEAVREALDRSAEAGRVLDLWWRDDDADRAGPALDRLLALAASSRMPLAIAAVPDKFEPSLPERLADEPDISVLVHGFRHANHAPAGAKPAEFGPHRGTDGLTRDARDGLGRVLAAFGQQALPVFVPPWNRIDPGFAGALPGLGYRGLSASGWPGIGRGPGGFARVDVHLDPVAWRAGGGLARPESLAAAIARATAGGGTVLGFLTHHLVFTAAHWDFTAAFLELALRHRAVRTRALAGIMDGTQPGSGPLEAGRPTTSPARPGTSPARPALAEAG